MRTFHLGRMSKPRVLPHSFQRPIGFDVTESFIESIGIYEGLEAEPVQLRFKDWAAQIACERVWLVPENAQATRRFIGTDFEGGGDSGITRIARAAICSVILIDRRIASLSKALPRPAP